MGHWHRRIPFKVDVAGIIQIMGTSLYSRITTPIRELIQNAHDAIMRRRARDLGYTGRIDIVQDPRRHALLVSDDGVGLTADEAERYLGTLGIGITGLIKRGQFAAAGGDGQALIGQFGIGLFSAFMLADRLIVETRHLEGEEAVRWEAGPGSDIELSSCDREGCGTTVTLFLKPECHRFTEDAKLLEEAVKEYAEFLPMPIFINQSATPANLINATWFDPTPDPEAMELELASFFDETPLDVIPIRSEHPVHTAGALYITPQRTPGFSDAAVVTVTLRRMVISRSIEGLLPQWASFLRGVLELNDWRGPTASREDLVRDGQFEAVQRHLEEAIYAHLEGLADRDRQRLASIITWHRYTLAGAGLLQPRLRRLLRRSCLFATSQGSLTFEQVLQRSDADALVEDTAEKVIWYNVDRRQENWANTIFASLSAPCVHTLRSFEESLLAAMAGDAAHDGVAVDMRPASPSSPHFASTILGVRDMEDAPAAWQAFFAATGARVFCASFDPKLPAMAFLNEHRDLMQSFEELKKAGAIPPGFQQLVDRHFEENRPGHNELLLNRKHPLVGQALQQSIHHPLASVLRLLAFNALATAGAAVTSASQRLQAEDLDWIAQALASRSK